VDAACDAVRPRPEVACLSTSHVIAANASVFFLERQVLDCLASHFARGTGGKGRVPCRRFPKPPIASYSCHK
jgi:hypothetical protein